MIKLKVSYSNPAEKDKLLSELKNNFNIIKISKELKAGGKDLYKRVYIDISDKA